MNLLGCAPCAPGRAWYIKWPNCWKTLGLTHQLLVSGWPFWVARAPVPVQPWWCCLGPVWEDVVAPLPLLDVRFRPASTVVGDPAALPLLGSATTAYCSSSRCASLVVYLALLVDTGGRTCLVSAYIAGGGDCTLVNLRGRDKVATSSEELMKRFLVDSVIDNFLFARIQNMKICHFRS